MLMAYPSKLLVLWLPHSKIMTNYMPKLKRLAEKLHCIIEESERFSISVIVKDGWSWEDGERCSMTRAYATGGHYLAQWRQDCIADIIEELTEYPPENTPYLYDEE